MAKTPKPAQGVTTSRSIAGNVQSTGGDLSGDHVIQGDTIAATPSEEQHIADKAKKDAEEAKAAEKEAKSKADKPFGEAGRYKILSGPNNKFPLSINGQARDMEVGGEYDLSKNDVEILTEARFKVERV